MLDLILQEGALWFTLPALIGTAVFVIRLVLMLMGLAGHDLALDVHVPDATLDAHHGDPGEAFKLLSVQSIAAFLMGFGWGGLGAFAGSDMGLLKSAIVGLAVGAGMMWVLARLLRFMFRMQASGNITIDATIGRDGVAYVSIPANGAGRGQVRLTVEGRDRIYTAVSEAGEVPTGAAARIVRANPDNSVTVRPI